MCIIFLIVLGSCIFLKNPAQIQQDQEENDTEEPVYTCNLTGGQISEPTCAGTCPDGQSCIKQYAAYDFQCGCGNPEDEYIPRIPNMCGYENYFYCEYPDPLSPQGCYYDQECCRYARDYHPEEYTGTATGGIIEGNCVSDPFLHWCSDGTCYWI